MVAASDEDAALAVEVLPGQSGDAPRLIPMLDRTLDRVPVDELVGDKGFDGDAQRHACVARDVSPVIPSRRNRVNPWPLDEEAYRERNWVERLFAKLKQFRRVATGYDKLKVTFLGFLHLALGFVRLRRLGSVNTT